MMTKIYLQLSLVSIFIFFSMVDSVTGQRIVNKVYFIFPKTTTIDTIGKKFPYKFLLILDSPLHLSKLAQKKADLIPKKVKSFFKPTYSEIALADSLIKADMLNAVIAGDSLLYVRNQLYKWYNQGPSDFYKYKATREKGYEIATFSNKKKVKHSDRYYFGYINKQDQKRIIILFDPKKIRYRTFGDLQDVDYCEPMLVDIGTNKISFGFFPFPDPD
jgi:hypothetical protein